METDRFDVTSDATVAGRAPGEAVYYTVVRSEYELTLCMHRCAFAPLVCCRVYID